MELFDVGSGYDKEQFLIQKAKHFNIPIGGTMELLPLCNMACRMCYVQKTKKEMESEGKILSCDDWLEIAEKMKEAGVLYLLLTGGEPLLFPELDRLYNNLMKMGFVITINTNGTLINEYWADIFAKAPCRRLNITLYGKDDETYNSLCGNPKGYSQVMNAVRLLKERNVPFRFNFTATPWNTGQLHELMNIANENSVPLSCTSYVFPAFDRDNSHARLSEKECAVAMIDIAKEKNPTFPMELHAKATLALLRQPIHNEKAGYHCGAGRNGFWINWHGELTCCGMIDQPKTSLLDKSFTEGWELIAGNYRNLPVCEACQVCKKRNLCKVCTAVCYRETGTTDGKPQYMCRVTEEMIKMLMPYLSDEEQKEYREILKE